MWCDLTHDQWGQTRLDLTPGIRQVGLVGPRCDGYGLSQNQLAGAVEDFSVWLVSITDIARGYYYSIYLKCHCDEKIFDPILNTTEQHF